MFPTTTNNNNNNNKKRVRFALRNPFANPPAVVAVLPTNNTSKRRVTVRSIRKACKDHRDLHLLAGTAVLLDNMGQILDAAADLPLHADAAPTKRTKRTKTSSKKDLEGFLRSCPVKFDSNLPVWETLTTTTTTTTTTTSTLVQGGLTDKEKKELAAMDAELAAMDEKDSWEALYGDYPSSYLLL